MNILLLAAMVLGCSNPTTEPAANVPGNSAMTASNIAAPDQLGERQTGGGQTQQADPPNQVNPYRSYQLKDLKVAKVKIDGHEFRLWVMDDFPKRQEGMMFLQETDYKDDQGMLFVFPDSAPRNFWMKNTLVPLDIAYVSPAKIILNVLTMAPMDTTTPYNSNGNAQYAIEVRSGTWKKLEIEAGAKVEIPEGIKAVD